jgi:hypothetical protein
MRNKKRILSLVLGILVQSVLVAAVEPSRQEALFRDFLRGIPKLASVSDGVELRTIAVRSIKLAPGVSLNDRLLENLLAEFIVRRENVKLIERAALDLILSEHELSLSDAADPAAALNTGQLLGVDAFLDIDLLSADRNRVVGFVSLIETETGVILYEQKLAGRFHGDHNIKIGVAWMPPYDMRVRGSDGDSEGIEYDHETGSIYTLSVSSTEALNTGSLWEFAFIGGLESDFSANARTDGDQVLRDAYDRYGDNQIEFYTEGYEERNVGYFGTYLSGGLGFAPFSLINHKLTFIRLYAGLGVSLKFFLSESRRFDSREEVDERGAWEGGMLSYLIPEALLRMEFSPLERIGGFVQVRSSLISGEPHNVFGNIASAGFNPFAIEVGCFLTPLSWNR